MIDEITRRVRAIDHRAAAGTLARHLATTNPTGIEMRARTQGTEVSVQLRHGAAIQLRVVSELPARLEQVVEHVCDGAHAVGLRVALRAILRAVIRHAQVVPRIDSEATAMLEPALVFHLLRAELRPWLPGTLAASEPPGVLGLLQLGVPDFMLPLVHGRVASTWRCFHRLLALSPEDLAHDEQLTTIDDRQLALLLRRPSAAAATPPSWPDASSLASELDIPIPRKLPEMGSLEQMATHRVSPTEC